MTESEKRKEAIGKYKRDEFGLIASAEYVFFEDGAVNWRSMIKPEFLYVNKEYFERYGKEVPSSIESLTDKQLLILLAGIKELAKLRGYSAVTYHVSGERDYVVASCRIDWVPNYETDGQSVTFEDYANASTENTDNFCHKFLETIACNRAFIRCVRNFLNIHIVGADEIDKSDSKGVSLDSSEDSEDLSVVSPSGSLEKIAGDKGLKNFEAFVAWLREQWRAETYKNQEAKNWTSFKEIPPKECRKLIAILSQIN